MKINKNYGEPTAFENLSYGDVFMVMGCCYMKVNNTNDLNNAVNLFDGDICHFTETQTVYLCDYEFTIL